MNFKINKIQNIISDEYQNLILEVNQNQPQLIDLSQLQNKNDDGVIHYPNISLNSNQLREVNNLSSLAAIMKIVNENKLKSFANIFNRKRNPDEDFDNNDDGHYNTDKFLSSLSNKYNEMIDAFISKYYQLFPPKSVSITVPRTFSIVHGYNRGYDDNMILGADITYVYHTIDPKEFVRVGYAHKNNNTNIISPITGFISPGFYPDENLSDFNPSPDFIKELNKINSKDSLFSKVVKKIRFDHVEGKTGDFILASDSGFVRGVFANYKSPDHTRNTSNVNNPDEYNPKYNIPKPMNKNNTEEQLTKINNLLKINDDIMTFDYNLLNDPDVIIQILDNFNINH